MNIKETATRPNPGGFGWSQQDRVIELAEGEAVPEGAISTDTDPHDWQPVVVDSVNFPGMKGAD